MAGLQNGYSASLGRLFTIMPKTVLAAVAVSFAARLFESEPVQVGEALWREWGALFDNGIVKQPPPRTTRWNR